MSLLSVTGNICEVSFQSFLFLLYLLKYSQLPGGFVNGLLDLALEDDRVSLSSVGALVGGGQEGVETLVEVERAGEVLVALR